MHISARFILSVTPTFIPFLCAGGSATLRRCTRQTPSCMTPRVQVGLTVFRVDHFIIPAATNRVSVRPFLIFGSVADPYPTFQLSRIRRPLNQEKGDNFE
jgi:hypothetical protein